MEGTASAMPCACTLASESPRASVGGAKGECSEMRQRVQGREHPDCAAWGPCGHCQDFAFLQEEGKIIVPFQTAA